MNKIEAQQAIERIIKSGHTVAEKDMRELHSIADMEYTLDIPYEVGD